MSNKKVSKRFSRLAALSPGSLISLYQYPSVQGSFTVFTEIPTDLGLGQEQEGPEEEQQEDGGEEGGEREEGEVEKKKTQGKERQLPDRAPEAAGAELVPPRLPADNFWSFTNNNSNLYVCTPEYGKFMDQIGLPRENRRNIE